MKVDSIWGQIKASLEHRIFENRETQQYVGIDAMPIDSHESLKKSMEEITGAKKKPKEINTLFIVPRKQFSFTNKILIGWLMLKVCYISLYYFLEIIQQTHMYAPLQT